ncbi:LytTR family DNA-binding domain-containing protein [Planctobacterium marinum]
MMAIWNWSPNYSGCYLFGSRVFTHTLFWVGYYVLFSFIWAKPEQGLFASFYLEFILMPVRIMAAYCMLYLLIPSYLVERRYRHFFGGYGLLIAVSGFLQLCFGYFFYETLLPGTNSGFGFNLAGWVRNCILINTTVLLLGTAKVFILYMGLLEKQSHAGKQQQNTQDFILVKSERRTCKLFFADILYVEGLGNYVTYHLVNGEKRIVYSSLKETQESLPEQFLRLHRSYLINRNAIESFNNEEVLVAGNALPRGKDIQDAELVI